VILVFTTTWERSITAENGVEQGGVLEAAPIQPAHVRRVQAA
jgi:hypothetical protein